MANAPRRRNPQACRSSLWSCTGSSRRSSREDRRDCHSHSFWGFGAKGTCHGKQNIHKVGKIWAVAVVVYLGGIQRVLGYCRSCLRVKGRTPARLVVSPAICGSIEWIVNTARRVVGTSQFPLLFGITLLLLFLKRASRSSVVVEDPIIDTRLFARNGWWSWW